MTGSTCRRLRAAAVKTVAVIVIIGSAGLAGHAIPIHQERPAHHQLVLESRRPVDLIWLVHFMPDTQPAGDPNVQSE